MRALVTGAGGFIGGHLVKALLDQGSEVRAADIRPQDEWKQVHPDAGNLGELDLSVAANARVATYGCDTIYHLAADSGGMGYISYHHADCMTNILADVQMARAALAEGARIYYASSSCIYPLHIQDDPWTPPIREEDALTNFWNPEKGYGWEKLYAEMTYQAYAQDHGLAARIGRYYSIYGTHGWYKGGREKAPTALCRKVAVAKLTGQGSIEIWGDGTARRTFTYVDDAVAATIAIAVSDVTEPLNVGSSKSSSILQLVETISDIAGHQVMCVSVDGPVGVGGRPSDDTKIRNMVGWKPQVSFREGMERTYAWTYDQVKAELGGR
jgi:nucleoside-diphosphate-sugar epimerase